MSPCLIVLMSWDSAFPLMPRARICSSSTADSRNKLCDLLFGSAKGTSSLRPNHIRSNSSRWNWALRDTCRIPARRSARSVSFLSDSFNLQNPRDCHTQRANGYLEVFLDLPYLHTAGHSRCTVCVGKDAMTASSGMECKNPIQLCSQQGTLHPRMCLETSSVQVKLNCRDVGWFPMLL